MRRTGGRCPNSLQDVVGVNELMLDNVTNATLTTREKSRNKGRNKKGRKKGKNRGINEGRRRKKGTRRKGRAVRGYHCNFIRLCEVGRPGRPRCGPGQKFLVQVRSSSSSSLPCPAGEGRAETVPPHPQRHHRHLLGARQEGDLLLRPRLEHPAGHHQHGHLQRGGGGRGAARRHL